MRPGAIVNLGGAVGRGLLEVEQRDVVLEGAPVVVRVVDDGRDLARFADGRVRVLHVVPVDENCQVGGGEALGAVGGGEDEVGRNERAAAERVLEGEDLVREQPDRPSVGRRAVRLALHHLRREVVWRAAERFAVR